MGKITTSIGIMTGVTFFAYLGGLIQDTPSAVLLTMILNPSNLQNIGLGMIFASSAATVLGFAAVLFSKQQGIDLYLFIPLVELLFSYGYDFLQIYQAMAAVSEIGKVVAIAIFSPFLLMYVIGVFEWLRGVET